MNPLTHPAKISLMLGLVVMCWSCYEQAKKESGKNIVHVYLKDTVISEIPETYRGGVYERTDIAIGNAFGLPDLRYGCDSLQIRITIDCGYATNSLILIEMTKSKWTAIFYSFKLRYYENRVVIVNDRAKEEKTPKSGWPKFIDSLMKTGIMNLPDVSKFYPKYNIPTDGNSVSVEVATGTRHRVYHYPAFEFNLNIKEGPGKLHEALMLIEREFNFTRPCGNPF